MALSAAVSRLTGVITITVPTGPRTDKVLWIEGMAWDELVASVAEQRQRYAAAEQQRLRDRIDAGMACWVDGEAA